MGQSVLVEPNGSADRRNPWALAVDGAGHAISAGSDGEVKLWPLRDLRACRIALQGHRATVYCLHVAGGESSW